MKIYIYPEAKLTQSEELIEMETTMSVKVRGTGIINQETIKVSLEHEGKLTDESTRTCRQLLIAKVENYAEPFPKS
tara:strand:- start:1566 stop:1793 length:228 start_codon:yes stop_codon:yes gene_type:complete